MTHFLECFWHIRCRRRDFRPALVVENRLKHHQLGERLSEATISTEFVVSFQISADFDDTLRREKHDLDCQNDDK